MRTWTQNPEVKDELTIRCNSCYASMESPDYMINYLLKNIANNIIYYFY